MGNQRGQSDTENTYVGLDNAWGQNCWIGVARKGNGNERTRHKRNSRWFGEWLGKKGNTQRRVVGHGTGIESRGLNKKRLQKVSRNSEI